MRRGWQIACLAFLAVSLVWMRESLTFSLKDALGPGPGFFPFWLSLLGAGLSAVLFVQVTRQPAPEGSPSGVLPSRPGRSGCSACSPGSWGPRCSWSRSASASRCSCSTPTSWWRWACGRWVVVAVFAVAGSFGVFHVFYHLLKVPLPIGILGI